MSPEDEFVIAGPAAGDPDLVRRCKNAARALRKEMLRIERKHGFDAMINAAFSLAIHAGVCSLGVAAMRERLTHYCDGLTVYAAVAGIEIDATSESRH